MPSQHLYQVNYKRSGYYLVRFLVVIMQRARKNCLTGEEIRYNPKGEYHLNNYLKNKTEKILNRTTKKTGNDKTRGSDLVKQFVSKLLRIC